MKLTAIEEVLVYGFRDFDPEQKRELLKGIRALVDANKVSRSLTNGKKLRVVGNFRVEETLGLPQPKKPARAPRRRKGPDHDIDPGMDDALG